MTLSTASPSQADANANSLTTNWAVRNREVDFSGARGKKLVVIEVKTGVRKQALPGVSAFAGRYPVTKRLPVGTERIPIEEFLLTSPITWFE
jgi:hypothetical protein